MVFKDHNTILSWNSLVSRTFINIIITNNYELQIAKKYFRYPKSKSKAFSYSILRTSPVPMKDLPNAEVKA